MLQPLPRRADTAGHICPHAPASVVQSYAGDAGQLAAGIPVWNIEYTQLSDGVFESCASLLSLGTTMLGRVSCNQVLLARGGSPAGAVSVIATGTGLAARWTGLAFERNDIVMLGAAAEIDLYAPKAFVQLIFSCSENGWRQTACDLGLDPDAAITHAAGLLSTHPVAIDLLRDYSDRLLAAASQYPDAFQQPALIRRIEKSLLNQLVQLTAPAADKTATCTLPVTRRIAVKRADDYMRAHLDEPLMLSDLCSAAGVSMRTLEYAFRELLGLTPVAYLKCLRLHQVRHDLCAHRSAPKKITAIAIHRGFWHMSQLTADYKRLFGETPSQTLRRVYV